MIGEERGRLVYQDGDGLLDLPAPKLFGRHQFDNAGTAIAALRAAKLDLPARAFEDGVVHADWPARMQRLTTGRLVGARATRAASCGLTAATTPMAGAAPPPRSPILKSACRVRW